MRDAVWVGNGLDLSSNLNYSNFAGQAYVVEQDGQIVRTWTETEPPETPASDTEVLNTMIGVSDNG